MAKKPTKKQTKAGNKAGQRKILQNKAPKQKSRMPLTAYNIPVEGGFQ